MIVKNLEALEKQCDERKWSMSGLISEADNQMCINGFYGDDFDYECAEVIDGKVVLTTIRCECVTKPVWVFDEELDCEDEVSSAEYEIKIL